MKYCKWCPRKPDECDGYDEIQVFYNCPLVDTFCDYKDVAEFEARCMNNAIIYAYIKAVEVRTLHEYMPEIIKAARLKAEEQMES